MHSAKLTSLHSLRVRRTLLGWAAALSAIAFASLLIAVIVTQVIGIGSDALAGALMLAVWLAVAFWIALEITDGKIRDFILKNGLRTTATIVSIQLRSHSSSGARNMELGLDVDLPEGEVLRTTADASIPINEVDLYYRVGDKTRVLLDPDTKKDVVAPPATRRH